MGEQATAKPRSLEGKVAIVTGGARGIGAAIARRLSHGGASILITYSRSAGAADDLCASLPGDAFAIAADATLPASARQAFDAATERFGGVDILIANAGVGALAPFASTTEEMFDRLFAITKGTFFAMQEASSRLRVGGRIVGISTGLTRNWAPMGAAYAGSKAAVEQFARSLSKEVGPRGITVNMVLPGVVETDMTSAMPDAMRQAAAAQTSFGRLGRPDDIADVVAFLASDQARWITGQMIVANGGSAP